MINNPAAKVNETPSKQTRQRSADASHHAAKTGRNCPKCGAAVEPDDEYCPSCGARLVDYCPSCGAPMDPGQEVCDECGMSSRGVRCPKCGTLNHRAFCSKCNTPLTMAAVRAVEKARKDPVFIMAQQLAEKAETLRRQLASADAPSAADASSVEASDAELEMQALLGGMSSSPEPQASAGIRQEYEDTLKDLDKLFEEMLPPAGSTPQEQRNYFSARKIVLTTVTEKKYTVTTPIEWICNYCGCHHKQPNECYKPFLGGQWVYDTKEITEVHTKTELIVDD